MPNIQLPSLLQKVAKIQSEALIVDGKTIEECLDNACNKHTDLRPHLFHLN